MMPVGVEYLVKIERDTDDDPMGETSGETLRLDFDRRLMLQFRGGVSTLMAGCWVYRALDDAVGQTDTCAASLAEARRGNNGRQLLTAYCTKSVVRTPDAEQLSYDPAMRWLIGARAIQWSRLCESWKNRRRCVARVERHPDELCPRVGFIVTKLGTAGRAGRRLLQPSRNADHDQTYALSRLRSHSFLDNIVAS